jgi:hypothetical protein
MKITKELLINLIKEELRKKEVRELDVVPGNTSKSKMFGDNHKVVLTKRNNTTTNKISYIVALIKGTGKDESITNLHKEFKKEEEATKFFDKLKAMKSLNDIKKSFDEDDKEDTKEGENES